MPPTSALASDADVIARIFAHIDGGTTDLGAAPWREPAAHYCDPARYAAELAQVMQARPTPFCPSAALPQPGSFLARTAAGTPLLAVRGGDGAVRVFRNACRHRGAELAAGAGCAKAFVCRYHGWTYGLDGALRQVPHAEGFPGLDRSTRGLVPVAAVEHGGVVFVTQRPAGAVNLDDIPQPLIPPQYRLHLSGQDEVAANWKLVVETFLEGYHLRSLHKGTFFPEQFDNLTVVERFGDHNRVTFPYRAIHKLRAAPPQQRSARGVLTYLYHLFPNAMVATFPTNITLVVVEPLAVDRSLILNYALTDLDEHDPELHAARGFVEAGAAEDRDIAAAMQRGLASGANAHLEFGLFEGAIGHFHQCLHAALAPAA